MRGFSFVSMQATDETIRGKALEAVKVYWLHTYSMTLPMQARRKLQALRDEAAKIQAPSETEYNQYMKSGAWLQRSERRKAAYRKLSNGPGLAPYGCGVCVCEESPDQPHHVHHLNYDHFGHEPPGDLLPLCVMCHCFIHPLGTMTDEVFREHPDNQQVALSLDHLRVYRRVIDDEIDDLVWVFIYIAAACQKSKPIDRNPQNVKRFLMDLAEDHGVDVLKSQLLYTWYTRGEIERSLRKYLNFGCQRNYEHDYDIDLLEALITDARQAQS